MTELTVLDVGHGNSAILRSGGVTAVIDAPIGSLLLDTLRDMGVSHIDAAFISHADKDHLAGIIVLLTSRDVTVGDLYLNADAPRRTRLWRNLLAAISVAEQKGGCNVFTSLSSTTPGSVELGDATLRVVAPSAAFVLAGVGGMTGDGKAITANALSAVLKVATGGGGGVLLAGDLDDVGLEDALVHGADLSANVLVFPHHGGSPGSDPTLFTKSLLTAVGAKSVIFSNGRNRFENPQSDIVAAVVAHGCGVACTQMAKACCNGPVTDDHLEDVRAHGRKPRHSCAGSMTFTLTGGAARASDKATQDFASFVATKVPSPMCKAKSAAILLKATVH